MNRLPTNAYRPIIEHSELPLLLQLVGKPFVVVVEQRDPFAARETHADIARLRAADIFTQMDDMQPLVANRRIASLVSRSGPSITTTISKSSKALGQHTAYRTLASSGGPASESRR